MTREEQLQRESEIYAWTANQFDVQLAFINGAKWADENPQFSKEEFIDEACEWLINSFNQLHNEYGNRLEFANKNDFIKAFKAAMEE